MAQIFKSTKPCCLCHKTEKTVLARLPDLTGVLCIECLYPRLEDKPKKVKKAKK